MSTFNLKKVKSTFGSYEIVGGSVIVSTPEGRKRIGSLVSDDTVLVESEFVDLLQGVSPKDDLEVNTPADSEG